MADAVETMKNGSDISAHVGAVQFDRPEALLLRYRLLPSHSAWSPMGERDLHLGKLRWGRYTLQVQAQLRSGPWSAISEQSFAVLRPAWLSWPALFLVGAGGSGAAASLSRWRKHRRFRREAVLPDLSVWRMGALSPETELLIGTIIDGRYEIGHILSVGGFATVARARDRKEGGRLSR